MKTQNLPLIQRRKFFHKTSQMGLDARNPYRYTMQTVPT